MKLRDPDLLHTRAFLGGKWLDAASGATHQVQNPATREPIGTVPDMGAAEARRAIEAAAAAFRLGGERADLVLLRHDAEAYLARSDAAQADRVRELLRDVPE